MLDLYLYRYLLIVLSVDGNNLSETVRITVVFSTNFSFLLSAVTPVKVLDLSMKALCGQWRIQDLPGETDHGERAEREPKRGSGAEPPAGSRGRAPGGGSGGLLYIFIQKSG